MNLTEPELKMKMQMKPKLAWAALAAGLLVCAPAWAQVYKCRAADGRMVFQQAPCAGGGGQVDVRPASGPGAAAAGSAAAGAAAAGVAGAAAGGQPQGQAMTEAQRIEARTQASLQQRRRRELQEFVVPGARSAIESHRQACRQRLAVLRDEQYRYVQNLYGKTHAAQKASEMAAEASQCEMKERELGAALERALQECRALQGCADMGF